MERGRRERLDEMTELAERLAALEDRFALMQVESSYARLFDSRNGEAWAELFAEDGIYQGRGASPTGGGTFVRGRLALARFCDGVPFDSLHLLHLPDLDVDGDFARGRVHFESIGIVHEGSESFRRKMGYYDVLYARIDGRWLIQRRVTTMFAGVSTATWNYPASSGSEV